MLVGGMPVRVLTGLGDALLKLCHTCTGMFGKTLTNDCNKIGCQCVVLLSVCGSSVFDLLSSSF